MTKKATTTTTGPKSVKPSSSAGTTKASLDDKMAKAKRLKEQQEAERKRKLEEKQAREAQRLEAMAQRRRELDAKKALKLGTAKPKTMDANEKPESGVTSKPKATAPVSRVRSGSTKTATSIPKATTAREVKKPTSTRTVTAKATTKPTVKSTVTKPPTTKLTATSKPATKPVSLPSKTVATRPVSTRIAVGARTTAASKTTAKPNAVKSGLKKPSSTKTGDVKTTRTKPSSKTTKDSPTKTSAKSAKQDKKQNEEESHVDDQVVGDVENERVTSVDPDNAVIRSDAFVESSVDPDNAVIQSGDSVETSGSPLSKHVSQSVPAITPSTASRVGQIIASQTSLSKDLQTRLPHAAVVGNTEETGEPQPMDETSEEPTPVEPTEGIYMYMYFV